MTITTTQVTDFSAIEDAIELWAATGSVLPQLTDADGNNLPKIKWSGYHHERKRPYGVISVISDRSPGRACQSQTPASGGAKETTYKYAWNWNIQIAFYQDAYDENGTALRATARQYARNLIDRYQQPEVATILLNAGIGYMPLSRSIQLTVLPNTDDDKYIHQAIVEFNFNGINTITSSDTDYFTDVELPTIEFPSDEIDIDLRTEDFLYMITESGDQMIAEATTY